MNETWSNRLYLFVHSDDLAALRDVAQSVTGSEAEQQTFIEVAPNWYGCNTAATESIRTSLNDGLSNLLASGMVGTLYVARLDNETGELQASYSASPSGFGSFGGTLNEAFSWTDALNELNKVI